MLKFLGLLLIVFPLAFANAQNLCAEADAGRAAQTQALFSSFANTFKSTNLFSFQRAIAQQLAQQEALRLQRMTEEWTQAQEIETAIDTANHSPAGISSELYERHSNYSRVRWAHTSAFAREAQNLIVQWLKATANSTAQIVPSYEPIFRDGTFQARVLLQTSQLNTYKILWLLPEEENVDLLTSEFNLQQNEFNICTSDSYARLCSTLTLADGQMHFTIEHHGVIQPCVPRT